MLKLIFSVLALFAVPQSFAQTSASAKDWKIVANKEVCMVTNVHFARPQIPVEQDGKTYFGCCENCKKTLATDASSRMATDPVSKKPVDKARATIAANSAGDVQYFENKANFERFLKQAAAQ